jgi:hypothetical protein
MVAVALVAIAVGVGVLFVRPTSLAVSIKIVNKTDVPLTNLKYQLDQIGGTIGFDTVQVISHAGTIGFTTAVRVIPPRETVVWPIGISGNPKVALGFSCTNSDGTAVSGQAGLDTQVYAFFTGTRYRVLTFVVESTGVTSTITDSAFIDPNVAPQIQLSE